MEEAAYTWFNRFIALRFMEINNYLPTHIRVFSDASSAFKPEILSNAIHLDLPGLDMEKVSDLIEKNQTEDLYRYLLLTQCNALSECLPRMFERMGSYTELLLPNNILRQDGVLGRMVTDIPEKDWTDQVQIIGWLYQYYNTELKDDTFALLKKNVKITKERIPSATQLFTPDWIVRYMIENSLGRLWIEGHPDDELKAGWKYYLDEAEQEPEVQAQLDAIRAEYRTLRPQDIKVIDPCMGSGHILVYAFDVLVQIYKRAGFSERDAAQSILENNLYGLDIDDRAAQLAYFAVMMKARQYDRRIFTRNIQPHVYAVVESNDIRIPAKWRLGSEQTIAEKLISELKDAKEYGSILKLSLNLDELASLRNRVIEIDKMSAEGNLLDMMESGEIVSGLIPMIDIAEIMIQQYQVVVTNPPYMGSSGMSGKLLTYVTDEYPDTKTDLSTVFMEHAISMCAKNGRVAMINIPVWMFLISFVNQRRSMIYQNTFVSLVHFGRGVFGADFGTVTFVINKQKIAKYKGTYLRLFDKSSSVDSIEKKEAWYLERKGLYHISQDAFENIDGTPIAYWATDAMLYAFHNYPALANVSDPRQGLITGDNDRFLRGWHEIEADKINKKWFIYNKGGNYRKWYGNCELVVNWENNGYEITNFVNTDTGRLRSRPQNIKYYFREGFTWTTLSIGDFSARYMPSGQIFDAKGSSCFASNTTEILNLLAFSNSVVSTEFLKILSPTVDYSAGSIGKLPIAPDVLSNIEVFEKTKKCVALAREDWDSFEISWDFEIHPIVKKSLSRFHWGHEGPITIEYVYKYVAQDFEERFRMLKANEEELNRTFIDIYNLQDELTPEVEDKDVTVRRADLGRDIRSMISYAVGCMFGRYSLVQWGLAYAGGEWNPGGHGFADYGEFEPDNDNIIPICDDEYFDDDITGRFIKWVEVVFGKETLEENLKYIADALGGKGTPREVIRSYFLNDFYTDHLKTYQKRPIYWLFDSGKKKGFKALIYMHRYQSDLLARMRTDYVHEQQERYRTQLKHIEDAMDSVSASERVKLAKQQKKLQEQALELQKYEEKIHHLADQNIEIDLDDGVKYNYTIFEEVLAKIR